MIWVDDKQVKVEHFPDGTQRISIPGVREIAPFAATILWKYDDEIDADLYYETFKKRVPDKFISYNAISSEC